MRIKRVQNNDAFFSLILVIVVFAVMITARGYALENPEEAIVAAGEDFVFTQKDLDAYGAFFASQKSTMSREEIARTALKFELLCREYRKNSKGQSGVESMGENSEGVAAKIRDGIKYTPKVLDDFKISNVVIESYYRSNPEKFSSGEAPDGTITVKPLDDELKNEIRFIIIEAKKDAIVKEFIDSLISKYHIKIFNQANFN